jgi:hypothetical protein
VWRLPLVHRSVPVSPLVDDGIEIHSVLNFLVENFNIGPITTADANLKAFLN